jgi:hypothetical protein
MVGSKTVTFAPRFGAPEPSGEALAGVATAAAAVVRARATASVRAMRRRPDPRMEASPLLGDRVVMRFVLSVGR